MVSWPWWHQQTGPDAYRIRELLRGVWDIHAMYGADEPWLWRGQANGSFALEPAIHTRVRNHSELEDANVETFTREFIFAAREAALDQHEGMKLPDLALLALRDAQESLERLGRYAGGFSTTCGMAASTYHPLVSLSAAAGLVSALSYRAAAVKRRIAKDPPDDEYRSSTWVYEPRIHPEVILEDLPPGDIRSVRPLIQLASTLVVSTPTELAMVRSFERAAGAYGHGDQVAARDRLSEQAEYAERPHQASPRPRSKRSRAPLRLRLKTCLKRPRVKANMEPSTVSSRPRFSLPFTGRESALRSFGNTLWDPPRAVTWWAHFKRRPFTWRNSRVPLCNGMRKSTVGRLSEPTQAVAWTSEASGLAVSGRQPRPQILTNSAFEEPASHSWESAFGGT